MNHYYDMVAKRKLAMIGNGHMFTEKEAERIVAGTAVAALEAFVNESDGFTPEYVARTTEGILPQSINRIDFWKEYFWKYAQQKERKGICDHQELLNDTLRAVRVRNSGERGTDFDYLLCRTFGLFRFMFGGKMDS